MFGILGIHFPIKLGWEQKSEFKLECRLCLIL